MDNNRFDDIIKQKAESFNDMTAPSGMEMSRMLDDLPTNALAGMLTLTKLFAITSGFFLITTFYFVYRSYQLEDAIYSLKKDIIEIGDQRYDYQLMTDTVFWDSLNSMTKRSFMIVPDSQYYVEPASLVIETASSNPVQLSKLDSQRFVSAVIDQLIASIANDPNLLARIKSVAPSSTLSSEKSEESVVSEKAAVDNVAVAKKKPLSASIANYWNREEILEQLQQDPEGQYLINSIASGTPISSSAEDRLNATIKKIDIKEMSAEQQLTIIDGIVKQDPGLIVKAIEEKLDIGTGNQEKDNEVLDKLKALADEKLEESEESALPIVAAIETVRDEQYKERQQSWWIAVSGGIGLLETDLTRENKLNFFALTGEFRPIKNLGVISGLALNIANGESYDLTSIDLTLFEDLSADIVDGPAEFKAYYSWINVPVNVRYYFITDKKLSPFISGGIQAKFLVSERYKFEAFGGETYPSFESSGTFIFPSYQVALGSLIQLSNRFSGGVEISRSFGDQDMAIFNESFNSMKFHLLLQYKLD
jgi:hypothetical protein